MNSRKYGSRLLLLDYISGHGPLSNALLKYTMPDFIDGKYRTALQKPSRESAYFYLSSLTYSIWRDKVLIAKDLATAGKARALIFNCE